MNSAIICETDGNFRFEGIAKDNKFNEMIVSVVEKKNQN